MTIQPRCLGWKRTGAAAALALWVTVAYPLSGGALAYALGRGWIARRTLDPYFAPIEATIGVPGDCFAADLLGHYLHRCARVGERHAASGM